MRDAASALRAEPGGSRPDEDQRIVVYDVSWDHYESLLEALGGRSGIRITYLEGALEIMSPSKPHETRTKMIARLLEGWALETRTPLIGYRSSTFRRRDEDRGGEPDECYTLGRVLADDPADPPDLVIEVAWTRGGLDKLSVYAGLGVPEVWLWRRAGLVVHRLVGSEYRVADASALLPTLDLELLTRFIERSDQTEAVLEFVDAIRATDQ